MALSLFIAILLFFPLLFLSRFLPEASLKSTKYLLVNIFFFNACNYYEEMLVERRPPFPQGLLTGRLGPCSGCLVRPHREQLWVRAPRILGFGARSGRRSGIY